HGLVTSSSSVTGTLRVQNEITTNASTTALTVSGALMVNNASSSINNLNVVTGTVTNASTTALTTAGVASTSVLRIDTLANGCLNITTGLVGSQACTGSNSKFATSTIDTNSIFNVGAGAVGIGTTTPRYELQSASTTAAQLALTAAATDNHWLFRNAGGLLYIATSSPTTFASSTLSALIIDTNGDLLAHGLITSSSSFTGTLRTQNEITTNASTTALTVSGALMVNNASSSINNLNVVTGTVTNASTTALTVSGALMVNAPTSTISYLQSMAATSTNLSYFSGGLI